jgi:hypothetical protein
MAIYGLLMPKSVFCKIDLVEFSETPDVLVLIPEACGKCGLPRTNEC